MSSTKKGRKSQPPAANLEEVLHAELDRVERRRRAVNPKGEASEKDATPGSGDPNRRDDPARRSWTLGLMGLAFSGGGIRSATFNLGILQALADNRILRHIDYLSTVSGGGYIGSWLTALVHREKVRASERLAKSQEEREGPAQQESEAVAEEAEEPHIVAVEERISVAGGEEVGGRRFDDDAPEDRAISFLRRYSNYLTPKLGLLSADTWSAVATYLRNFILNLILLLSFLGAVLLLPRLVALIPASDWLEGPDKGLVYGYLLLISLAASVVAVWVLTVNMATFAAGRESRVGAHDQKGLILKFVVPMGFATLLASVWMPEAARSELVIPGLSMLVPTLDVPDWLKWGIWVGSIGVVVFLGAWLRALVASPRRESESDAPEDGLWAAVTGEAARKKHALGFAWVVSAFAAGVPSGAALWWIAQSWAQYPIPIVQLTVVPPLLLAWLALMGALQIGILGREIEDDQREWLSRLGGWLLIVALAWLALFGISLAGPDLLVAAGGYLKAALVSGWLLTTIGGLFASRSVKESGGAGNTARTLLVTLAPYVFIVGLVAVLAMAMQKGIVSTHQKVFENEAQARQETIQGQEHGAVGGQKEEALALERAIAQLSRTTREYHLRLQPRQDSDQTESSTAQSEKFPGVIQVRALEARDVGLADLWSAYVGLINASQRPSVLAGWFAALILIVLILQWRLDLNEFSMYRFYGNRLARCYLGASLKPEEREKTRQQFTGFAEDDIALADIDHNGPYHIVNTALNLSTDNELAWQERKGASFILAPEYCGYALPYDEVYADDKGGDPTDTGQEKANDGFRETRKYAARPAILKLTLGDAMTTSGAAASPNMGFRTSAAFAFLMTVFNVRLGRWIGNPRSERKWRFSSPRATIVYLLMELLGLANRKRGFVYLSDGGHFDNLGIYELVRRRCRFIIACDAGADFDHSFEDLGNTIRKCRNDFAVDIRIDVGEIRDRADGRNSGRHCAIGEIAYPTQNGFELGTLLYIKSSITGDEPEDVQNYAAEHPTFPHQTTGDQFFSEAQFESYRRLGHHVGTEVFGDLASRSEIAGQLNMESLFMRLGYRWHPSSHGTDESFAHHARALDVLFERQRTSRNLKFLDKQFYPEWRVVDQTGEHRSEDMMAVPDDEIRFREGFYFCNSLIQLMENVYIDLRLDHEADHPDNRGWMNLFNHWSWSGMFRVTWAISAATYGNRFQLFCERQLGLGLGRVEVNTIDVSDGAIADSYRTARQELRPTCLNFYEREQIELLMSSPDDVRHMELRQLDLQVPEARLENKPFVFSFGYCVLVGAEIRYFRVQDHLRKMGLGRRALEQLFASRPDTGRDLTLGKIETLPKALTEADMTEETRNSFRRLFTSVKNQGVYPKED